MYEAYKKPNLVHNLEKDPEHFFEFRFPTSEDEMALERYIDTGHTLLEAQIYQIALIFEATNLEIEEGTPVLTKGDPIAMKLTTLAMMPLGMVEELSEAVAEFYPDWKLTE